MSYGPEFSRTPAAHPKPRKSAVKFRSSQGESARGQARSCLMCLDEGWTQLLRYTEVPSESY